MSHSVRLVLLLVAFSSLACAKNALDPSTMVAASPEAPVEYKEGLSIEEIEKLKPQLRFPITLAISQPSSWKGWSAKEIQVIESWEEPLRASGFIKDLVVLPASLSEACGWRMSYQCGIWRDRATAARFRADALLLMSAHTETTAHSTPLSIFNLTVVGMWLVPAHHRGAITLLEGSLIDNRNEYLYAFARAYGEARQLRPKIYTDSDKVIRESRLAALRTFGERMIEQVNDFGKDVLSGPEDR